MLSRPKKADTNAMIPSENVSQSGRKKGGRRTAAQVHKITIETAELIARGLSKSAIKRELKERHGLIYRDAERYIVRAYEMEEKTDSHSLEILDLLLTGYSVTKIRQKFNAEHGMDRWEVDQHVSRARKIAEYESAKTRDQLREESYARYMAIMRDPSATPANKITAQKAIDRLFGLTSPVNLRVTDGVGNDIGSEEARLRLVNIAMSLAGGSETVARDADMD